MKDALKRLLDALDAIGEAHGEICDTEVRERMHEVIYAQFVQAREDAEVPTSLGMFSPEGNTAVGAALAAFLADPAVAALREDASPQERLDAFQDHTVLSDEEMVYDEYFGHADGLY